MVHRPELSEEEWALVIDLLQRELRDLPVEIRHTRVSEVRADLSRRRDAIRQLLERLRAPAAV